MPYYLIKTIPVGEYITGFFQLISPVFIWYFTIINLVYTILLFIGIYKLLDRYKELRTENFSTIFKSNSLPPISFILPMFNEEEAVMRTIHNLVGLNYRYKQIILVNDGSTDNTMAKLKKELELVDVPSLHNQKLPSKTVRGTYRSKTNPDIYVIDKENGRKFDAINAGLNACSTPYFIVVDADTYVDNSCFNSLIRPILSHPNAVAIGSTVRIKNGCDLEYNRVLTEGFPYNFISLMQGMEYLRSFIIRQGWNACKGHFVVAGAFSIFPTQLIKDIGGFYNTVAEDMEIVIRLQRLMKEKKMKYDLFYLPDPVAWTEGPSKWSVLGRQRIRWQMGEIESTWFHKKMLFNPKYGFFGLFVYPFMVFSEILEPVIEMLGFTTIAIGWFFGFLNVQYMTFLFIISFGYSTLFTLFCLCIEEITYHTYPTFRNLILWLFYSMVENLGYRQITIYWRAIGGFQFLKRWKIVKHNSAEIDEIMEKCSTKKFTIAPGKFNQNSL